MAKDKPLVFISYSHDSPKHLKLVRGLDASLVRDGCDCILDIYKETGETWTDWMTQHLSNADYVLCVITENYKKRFNNQEKNDVGHGTVWEAKLIKSLLSKAKTINTVFFPVFFEPSDKQHIPLILEDYVYFPLDDKTGYEKLLRKIHDKPFYQRDSPLGEIPDLPTEIVEPLFPKPLFPKPEENNESPDPPKNIAAIKAGLCVAIKIPLNNGKTSFGTGYAIGPDWILSAYHVLFNNDVNEHPYPISITWRDQSNRAITLTQEVSSDCIEWYDEESDIALLRCKCPHNDLALANEIIASEYPTSQMEWESYAYLASSKNPQNLNEEINLSGKETDYAVGDNKANFIGGIDLSSDIFSSSDPEPWDGFSGSPVFADNQLIAIVSKTNIKKEQKNGQIELVGTFIAPNLEKIGGPQQKRLAQLLGIDIDTDFLLSREKWFPPLFIAALKHSEIVKETAIEVFNTLVKGQEVKDEKALAEILLKCSPEQCVEFIETLHSKLKGKLPTRAVIHELAILMLGLVFPNNKAIRSIKASRNNGESIITSETADYLDTEAAMALADGQPLSVEYKKGESHYPYNVSIKGHRSGLDSMGKQAVEDISKHLINQGVPTQSNDIKSEDIISHLWTEAFGNDDSGRLVAKKKEVGGKLKSLAKHTDQKERSYYVCLPTHMSADEKQHFAQLKNFFNRLDLISLNEFTDDRTADLFAALGSVMKATHGKENEK